MIIRRQFRGCFQEKASSNPVFWQSLSMAEKEVEKLIRDNVLLQASLFSYKTMCFLYYEAISQDPTPETFLHCLHPYMEFGLEEIGETPWVPMYCIYYHSIPQNETYWESGRIGKKRIGRIAFLYANRVAEYVYWHRRIIDEGLFLGDQYQFISLHENILFSYFEEPKKMVNIRNTDGESVAIQEYMKDVAPKLFDRTYTHDNNFLVLPQLLSIGRSDLL